MSGEKTMSIKELLRTNFKGRFNAGVFHYREVGKWEYRNNNGYSIGIIKGYQGGLAWFFYPEEGKSFDEEQSRDIGWFLGFLRKQFSDGESTT